MDRNHIFMLLLVGATLMAATPGQAWTTPILPGTKTTPTTNTCFRRSSSTITSLEARRSKRGSLGTLAKEGLIEPPSTKSSSSLKRNTSKSTNNTAGGKSKKSKGGAPDTAGNISPALAAWMANNQNGEENQEEISASTATTDDSSTTASTTAFQSFDQDDDETNGSAKATTSARRVKQSQRNQFEEERQTQIESAVKSLEEALEGKNNLQEILAAVNQLLTLPPSPTSKDNPRLLLGGKQRYDYRLAWVGSDDAICHIGTGLHKVPLARLQELFWTCLGKNRVELLEVIRILGPFPNVRNTLQGTAKLVKSSSSSSTGGSALADNSVPPTLNIVMDSMIDGTGKEILAGTEDNIRRVNLQLYFADERVMVAVVPPEDGSLRANPLVNSGSNVLVFLREEGLDEKLDALRVS